MNSPDRRRRHRLGSSCLAAALGLLVAGLTVLDGRLSPGPFAALWLACLACTFGAVAAAVLDLRAVRRAAEAEQQALATETHQQIERDSRPPSAG